MSDLPFSRALAHFGGNHSALAKAIGTSQQRVSYIVGKGNPCPADLVIAVERETGVARGLLRPDLYPEEAAKIAMCAHCGARTDHPSVASCTSPRCPLARGEQEAA